MATGCCMQGGHVRMTARPQQPACCPSTHRHMHTRARARCCEFVHWWETAIQIQHQSSKASFVHLYAPLCIPQIINGQSSLIDDDFGYSRSNHLSVLVCALQHERKRKRICLWLLPTSIANCCWSPDCSYLLSCLTGQAIRSAGYPV